ncbi:MULTISPECIES: hypothetical protein [unclassified Streptomyces]|uniref:hypothetical protein n=1 Tax=unclassified Streptomyces TaxID=2593676 RepID=UPI002E2A557A|nr:hypothetical protein [Streptomyces sp. NBC_01423]WSX95139.1 hypothetical protein OH827_33405 [Streptomyces sp. NBC_00891]WSZ11239.1 hypothetical protein OG704_33410 [Streptomyces sp. NBC_00869]
MTARTPLRVSTDSTAPASKGRSPRPPGYGVASSVLLARADRGYARFLGRHGEDQDDGAEGGEDPPVAVGPHKVSASARPAPA